MTSRSTPLCPRCGSEPLVRHAVATGGIAHQCPRCHGTQRSLAVLRGRSGDALLPRLWAEANAHPRPGVACPLCRRSAIALMAEGMELDLCRPCQSLWFDADELERLPIRGAPTRRETVVDTTKRQSPSRRTGRDDDDEDSVMKDVVDAVFDVLTDWD